MIIRVREQEAIQDYNNNPELDLRYISPELIDTTTLPTRDMDGNHPRPQLYTVLVISGVTSLLANRIFPLFPLEPRL
jgi:hypothetical protein